MGPDFIKEVLADTVPLCCEEVAVEGAPMDSYLPGLEGPAGLPLVTTALQRRGWPEEDIRAVLGENVRRLLHRELDRSAAAS
jgi:membrane dipeptidase